MGRRKDPPIRTSFKKGEKYTDTISNCIPCSGRGWSNEKNPKTGFTRSVICSFCDGNGTVRTRG